MKLEFLGAAHEVTGSCHYLRIGDINQIGRASCRERVWYLV